MEYVILILCIIAVIIVAKVFSWPFKKYCWTLFNISNKQLWCKYKSSYTI